MLRKSSVILLLLSSWVYSGAIEQAVGFYSHGNLVNPDHLPDEGDGFVKIFRSRSRGYGTAGIMDLISTTAAAIRAEFPDGERLQIGDIAQKGGGEISGHVSHQNGLDADIAFYRLSHGEQEASGDTGFKESFVIDGKLSSNFDLERNWTILNHFAGNGHVTRIFVDPVIKQALCDYSKSIGKYSDDSPALRLLRPYRNHRDHMHVRMECPSDSPKCVKQDSVPSGSGCDSIEKDAALEFETE